MAFSYFLLQETVSEAATATEKAWDTVAGMAAGFWKQLPYIAVGLAVLLIFVLIGAISKKFIRKAVIKTGFDEMIASLLARMGFFAIVIIGFFISAVIVFPGLSPGDLLAGLGIGSVALGFAFKDVLQNLFAGFLILLYRPFHLGDQIKIDDYEGTVEEISVRATKIKTYDNERVIIPNSQLYMNSVLVKTAFPQRRTSFVVGIGYEDDIEEARKILFEVLTNSEGVLEDPAPTIDVDSLGDNAVNLKIRFWTDSVNSSVRKASNNMVTKIKYALDDKGIDMPYPTRVVFNKNQ